MEQKIINKAKKILANADTGTNDCKNYNNGFMDGVKYAIKSLRQPPVKRRIKTQQGFSQHILELSEEDAKIYTDLLDRNKLWWADVTNSRY